MSELVVVANRGPVSFRRDDEGRVVAGHGAGGLAPSLANALSGRGAAWIAAAMTDVEREVADSGELDGLLEGLDLHLVVFEPAVLSAAYNVVANSTLWFLLHGMFDLVHRPLLDRRWHEAWEAYRAYNAAFAERVAEVADEGATVVVNDYHLALMGSELARRRPDVSSVHFTHTPFSSASELAVLPREIRRELLDAMSSFGAAGFHSPRWRDRFVDAAHEVLGNEPFAFVTPLGSDPDELAEHAGSPLVHEHRRRLRDRVDGRLLIVRSDRVEPSKNLIRGFLAFSELLERDPSLVSRVRFVARAYASRTGLAEYLSYRAEVEQVAAMVNERFAKAAGGDVIELEIGDDFPASLALLSEYDVLLVNPIRDGMNLVAKEGPIVNANDGVLALSVEAGAYAELGGEAIGLEPFDVSGTAAALATALAMPADERKRRAEALRAKSAAMPPRRWLDELIEHARPTAG